MHLILSFILEVNVEIIHLTEIIINNLDTVKSRIYSAREKLVFEVCAEIVQYIKSVSVTSLYGRRYNSVFKLSRDKITCSK